ncbi:MAG TPA: tripartite tricarboxylate transporter substrate binding protein [Ramlibacter sp.]|uniref:Bug family tripartite tricarboxylate transporter substrate binding protein n=1 Tax=Ramlibacter sp. TaxID=1917967 RepID=UPI002ED11B40
MKFLRTALLLLAAAALAPAFAQGDGYPARAVTVVVPFPAGNSGDVLWRTLGESLSKEWGKPLVVDNKPGSGGALGAQLVTKAPADGYTLLHGSSGPIAIGPHLNKNVTYDPRKDFTPIMLVAGVTQAIVVRADSRFKTVQELIAHAKANPGKLNYGSAGNGSTQHLTGELFKQRANVFITHVPYRGAAPAYTDLLGGQVDFVVDSISSAVPFVQSKQMRILAVSTAKRDPVAPDAPTLAESGLPGFDVLGWMGLVGPPNMNPAVRDRINADVRKAMAQESVKQTFAKLGLQAVGGSAEDFRRYIDSEYARWGDVVKAAGIKPE